MIYFFQYGLYSAFVPGLVYLLLGTCPQVTVGPVALMAVMCSPFGRFGPAYAVLLTLITGVIVTLCGVLRLGEEKQQQQQQQQQRRQQVNNDSSNLTTIIQQQQQLNSSSSNCYSQFNSVTALTTTVLLFGCPLQASWWTSSPCP